MKKAVRRLNKKGFYYKRSVTTGSILLLGAETDGLAIDFTDLSATVRDTATPANSFQGNVNSLLTYTSPSTKWIRNKAGLLVSGTTLRTEYDASGNALGVRVEAERTNLALHSDDFTQAAWTKSDLTAAKTATGPDGVANSASTLTATDANATALQAITSASAARITSCYIRRRTGSGDIDLTQDNGSTWTTVTVTASWTRVEIASVTSANPTVGIRIVTSGDEVDVAFFQHEVGVQGVTSPIRTAGSTVTRNNDTIALSLDDFPFAHGAAGSGLVVGRSNTVAGQTFAFYGTTAGSNHIFLQQTDTGAGLLQVVASSSVSTNLGTSNTVALGSEVRIAGAWDEDDFAVTLNGGTVATDTSGDLPTTTGETVKFSAGINGNQLKWLKQILYVPRRMSNTELQALTA